MKIANVEAIKGGERGLIDAITANIDWVTIGDIFRKRHKFGLEEDVQYKRGDIVVHNNQIAYKLDFEVRVSLSLLLDREGNYLSAIATAGLDKTEEEKLVEEPEKLWIEPGQEPDMQASGSIETSGGPQAILEPEERLTLGDLPEPQEGPQQMVEELAPAEAEETAEKMPPLSPPESSQQRISKMATQVGEMLEEIRDKG